MSSNSVTTPFPQSIPENHLCISILELKQTAMGKYNIHVKAQYRFSSAHSAMLQKQLPSLSSVLADPQVGTRKSLANRLYTQIMETEHISREFHFHNEADPGIENISRRVFATLDRMYKISY